MSEILVNTIKKADGTGSITVPADTGTVLTSGSALSSFPTGFANGITVAEQWVLTTSFALSGGSGTIPITSNLARATNDGAGTVNAGMTESSGVFTFPSTGIWKITFQCNTRTTTGSNRFTHADIQTTTDGTNFDLAARGSQGLDYYSSNWNHSLSYCEFIFDVTNTSTHKVRFTTNDVGGGEVLGNTGVIQSGFTFIRLGDT